MMQVCARVIMTIRRCSFRRCSGGQFQLNIMMPVMGLAALESVQLLAGCTKAFVDFCIPSGDECAMSRPARNRIPEKSLLDGGKGDLNPSHRPRTAAACRKEAFKSGKTIRGLCQEKMRAGTLLKKNSTAVVSESELTAALDPRSMTEPERLK